MKPYLAIIKDSFREAMVSRVLWIILIICTLFLLSLLPIRVENVYATRYFPNEIEDPKAIARLVISRESSGEAPFLRSSFREGFVTSIPQLLEGDSRRLSFQLALELTPLLARKDLCDNQLIGAAKQDIVSKRLLSKGVGKLSGFELAQLNRRLLASAMPGILSLPEAQHNRIGLVGFYFSPGESDREQQIQILLTTLASVMVGVFGVLLPILFTAPMIPRTFESGAVDMLLSKPVARHSIFFGRYLGGCAFVVLISAYTIIGTFLVSGLSLGFWAPRILLCVPVFVFNFAVYYGVSALVGVITRNAIVSIFLTLLFMVACWCVGMTRQKALDFWFEPSNKVTLLRAGDDLIAVDLSGQALKWSLSTRSWEKTFTTGRQKMMTMTEVHLGGKYVGPVYDPKNKRLLALTNHTSALIVGEEVKEWNAERGPLLPAGVQALFLHPDGSVYCVNSKYLFRLVAHSDQLTESFLRVSEDLAMGGEPKIAIHPTNGTVAVFARGNLVTLDKDERDQFVVTASLNNMPTKNGLISYSGNNLFCAGEDHVVRVFDRELKEIRSSVPLEDELPRAMFTSHDGMSIALLYHNGQLLLLKDSGGGFVLAPVSGQGTITAAAFTGADELLVASDLTKVDIYGDKGFGEHKPLIAKMGRLEKFFRFFVVPLHTVCPKPSQISDLSIYLVTGERSFTQSQDLSRYRQRMDVWQPVWSNLIFLAVMLAAGCFHVSRRDY